MTGDARETDATGRVRAETHLDPDGVNVGVASPFSSGGGEGELGGGGEGMSQAGVDARVAQLVPGWGGPQCSVNHLSAGCGFIDGFVTNEAGALCPNKGCGPRIGSDGKLHPLTTNRNTGELGYWEDTPDPHRTYREYNEEDGWYDAITTPSQRWVSLPTSRIFSGFGGTSTSANVPQEPSKPRFDRQNDANRTCTIRVRITGAGMSGADSMPTPARVHMYILIKDSLNMFTEVTRAGKGSDGLLQSVYYERYGEGAPDWEEGEPPAVTRTLPGSCDKYIKSFKDTNDRVNNSRIPYGHISTNSNAYVYTALKRTELNPEFFGEKFLGLSLNPINMIPPLIPGWGTELQLK